MQRRITGASHPQVDNSINPDTPKALIPLLYGVKPFLKAPVKVASFVSEHYIEEEDPDFLPEDDDHDEEDEFSSEADDDDDEE